jgi:hypothetical protein
LELAISLRGAVTNGIDSSRKFDGEFARGSSTYAGTGTLRIGAGEHWMRRKIQFPIDSCYNNLS